MKLAPFGVLHDEYKKDNLTDNLYKPMKVWPDGEAAFRALLDTWLQDITSNVWPAWESGAWVGSASANMETETKKELEIAVNLYYGRGKKEDILRVVPEIPPTPDGRTPDHKWHYKIEDALVLDRWFLYKKKGVTGEPSYDFRASQKVGSNYRVYDPTFDDIGQFENLFWGRMLDIQPPIWNIKQHFQRPRPWSAATALSVEDFRWVVAGEPFSTHTGMHPSLLSGHCIQGILGGCNVFDSLLKNGIRIDDQRKRAMQKYMVDWGDRRVFAGVHYMTDNIASWTLARRLIPYLFRSNAKEVEEFAVQSIVRHSRVFADIVDKFDQSSPARVMLLSDFPESNVIS